MAGEQLEEHNGISSGFVSFARNGTTLDGYLTRPRVTGKHTRA